jgi:hypothetical protein
VSDAVYLPNEIERLYFQNPSCRVLRSGEISRFKAAGVAPSVIACPDMMLAASVEFFEDSRFLFKHEIDDPAGATSAFVLLCRDDFGDVIDIAAWSPAMGRLATWHGRAWALDQYRVLTPRISDHGALPILKDPLGWLRAGRNGIVILDPEKAKWQVAYARPTLLAEDVAHGQALRKALTISAPAIFIPPSASNQRAAA